MQYNESLYNGGSYNLTSYTQALVETMTPADAAPTFSIGIVKTDSQGSADAIGGSASLQAFLETVTIYQRANTPFAYNNGRYNDYMYNARADEDEILLMATKALSDSFTTTDTLNSSAIKLLNETIMGADATAILTPTKILDEFLFLSELHQIEITNKTLSDTVRLADWLSIERHPQVNNWGD